MYRSESHPDLYRNELTRLKFGNPIWEPNPGTLYDCVRIGDVGYFHNDQFMPLFNILPPSDDSNQNRRLPFPQPTNFPVLDLPATYPTTQNRHPLQAGVYALESSLTFSASVGLDSAGSVLNGESSLSFTNKKGAALILPYEACREDTLYDGSFKDHMLLYYRQWYTFALTKCHRNIKLCDLILVTGCDMSRQWATATYFRHIRETSAALGAQVAPVVEAKFSLSAGWRTTQPVITRWGPPQALHQQTRPDYEGTQNDSETLVNDQCIFLRGLYVKDRLLGPQVMKAGAGYHDPGKHGPEEEGAEGVLSDEGVAVEALLPSTQGQRFMTVLLDYMLEECDADVVIASDSDLWPYLGGVENPEKFHDTLKSISPPIKVEDGVGSLIMQMTPGAPGREREADLAVVMGSFTGSPDEYNPTNATIWKHHEMERRAFETKGAEANVADAQRRAEKSAKIEADSREREADILKRELEEELKEELRLAQLEVRLQGEEVEKHWQEKEVNEILEEFKRMIYEYKKTRLEAQRCELEANARVLETQKREAEAREAADEAQKREDQIQKDLQQANFYLEKGIQPEVWPTEEEFQLAKNRIQYDREKLHFAVCGSSGSGKSSLINAFRGLKNNSRQAAPTGVVDTTMNITRYPELRKELPYKRLVWFDFPGAGTLEIPGWQYFNQQGLFIFDIIVLVYDSRFTQIDVSIIKNCERFKIPLFIVRSKADMHMRNLMYDIGYDENDDNADDENDDFQRRARQLLIDTTRKNIEENLEKAELNKHDVFIVTASIIFSLVNSKAIKKTTPAIDEARLMESILKMAHARRYGTQASTENH